MIYIKLSQNQENQKLGANHYPHPVMFSIACAKVIQIGKNHKTLS